MSPGGPEQACLNVFPPQVRLGSPVTGYGVDARSRTARHHIRHRQFQARTVRGMLLRRAFTQLMHIWSFGRNTAG